MTFLESVTASSMVRLHRTCCSEDFAQPLSIYGQNAVLCDRVNFTGTDL